MEKITLSYGGGGALTHELITGLFISAFKNQYLEKLDDSAVLALKKGEYAMTTDSYVVDPIFFPGGDIGKMAVCGTVNDLASCGAQPLYLTAGFIIEEGLPYEILKKVVLSMAQEAKKANVKIVAGDTKVVPRGKADKLFINTAGIGLACKRLDVNKIKAGDKILINGLVAQHGLSILLSREKFSYGGKVKSDCNSLWPVVKLLFQENIDIHFMRDPTRGGISAATNEIAAGCGLSFLLREERIPVSASCRNLSEILGLELLDIANEGKMIFFISASDADKALNILKKHPLSRQASIIGEVLNEKKPRVYLETSIGGRKLLSMPMREPIPRIC
ncbi:MAG: hydrogenase expression/formation protein HypE [Candidatus Omnitrophota bacterium]